MAHARWLLAGLISFAWIAESRAQVILYPNPYEYGSYTYSRGFRFKGHKRRFSFWGSVGSSYTVGGYGFGFVGPGFLLGPGFLPPYGTLVQNINVTMPPPTTSANQARTKTIEEETAGIDLDEIDPVTMKPRQPDKDRPELAKRPPPQPPPPRPDRDPRQPPPPKPVPQEAEDEPRDEFDFLIFRGRKEFAAKNYGQAAQRFQQATLLAPKAPLPYFLLAQTQFALGKYRLAVQSIHAGMDLKKNWPAAKFSSRDLYQENEVEFLAHLKRLEDVVDKQPQAAALLFLWAHQLWFDGKRDKAKPIFQKARKVAADPTYIDRFLKVD
jgi:hypothetical protein